MSMSKRGFTLIELLVVIAIIGILSSVVLASLNSARQKSRDSRRVADVKQLQNALELFYDANSSYPTSTSLAVLAPTYIATIPKDPQDPQSVYAYSGLDSSAAASAGVTCQAANGKCPSYVIIATLEDASNPAFTNDVDGTPNTGLDCTDANKKYCARP
jgi:type II secretion system protein G